MFQDQEKTWDFCVLYAQSKMSARKVSVPKLEIRFSLFVPKLEIYLCLKTIRGNDVSNLYFLSKKIKVLNLFNVSQFLRVK